MKTITFNAVGVSGKCCLLTQRCITTSRNGSDKGFDSRCMTNSERKCLTNKAEINTQPLPLPILSQSRQRKQGGGLRL